MDKCSKLIFYGNSDTGRQRSNNEDAFVLERLDECTLLTVVIDGVGGYEGGEVAAGIAKEEIPKYLTEHANGEQFESLKQAVVEANNAIFFQRQKDAIRPNMSCVLTSALINTEKKIIDMVHVGDTRLYQYYRGGLEKLSHDHSYVGYIEEIGMITEEQAMCHLRRNEISRAVGDSRHEVYDSDFLEASEFPLLPNSTLLLCSDGLTDLVTRGEITAIIEQNIILEEKVHQLIKAANDAGGKDNITVVLVEYQAEEDQSETALPIAEGNDGEKKDDGIPTENERKEKCNGKNKMYILIGCFAILLAACIGLFVFSMILYHSVQNLENRVSDVEIQMNRITADTSTFDPINALNDSLPNPVKTMAIYSQAIEKNDYATISQVFADQVRQYYRAKDKSNAEVVEFHKKYDARYGVTNKHISIRWDTWETETLPNGETIADFVEDYQIDRVDTTKKMLFELYYHVTFDPNGKIVSIYYDDLTKAN